MIATGTRAGDAARAVDEAFIEIVCADEERRVSRALRAPEAPC